MSEVRNIPKHWQIKKLGEICEFTQGIQVDINKQKDTAFENSVRFLRIIDFTQSGELPRYIENPGERYLLKKGEIAMVRYGTVGFVCIGKEGAIANNLFKIKPKEFIDSKYLIYFLKSLLFISKLETKGATMQALSFGLIKPIPFPFPPLPEQELIVSKIEELLSDLDNGKQQLQIAQQQLKVYRQSLLKWAFEGKLTKTLSVWQNVKFDEVANAIDPQPSHRTPPIAQNGVPFISIKDFDSEADKIDFSNARRVSPDVLNEHLKRYKLEIGDFVIGKIGTIGKPVRIVLPQNYTLSANIVLIQPRKVNATYLYYFFQSSLIEKAFTAGMNSTTQAAFGIQKVRELRIELPNKEEQQLIVDELESKLTVCDKIEETISQSLHQAGTLRQSILKKAFEGKLI